MDKSQHAALNKKKWDRRAEGWDDNRHGYFRFMQKRLVAQLDLKENRTLLDLGCGTGRASGYAAGLVNGRGGFYGLDISVKTIKNTL
jgi:ubiquinone/menaquinone biosynthesis C-methylase UbiE